MEHHLRRGTRSRRKSLQPLYLLMTLLVLVGVMAIFSARSNLMAHPLMQPVGAGVVQSRQGTFGPPSLAHQSSNGTAQTQNPGSYIYYTLKESSGFVLARASKGADGQPLSAPQGVVPFGSGFGLEESDSVLSMQLSPDGRYLAIDGTRDHGEQVWVYDTVHMTIRLVPAYVIGNFLHWLPGLMSHTFLYRPMFPMGPSTPMDGKDGWNPGLWEVDAATGIHRNIDIHVPSAFLVDAVPSPDGMRILYSTSAGLGMGSDSWLMNSDGSNLVHLFRLAGSTQSIAGLFSWSPDGTMIAYERLTDSPTPFLPAGLWVMNTSGASQRLLASTDGGHGYVPVWSPDSRKIAFVVRTNVANHQADLSMQALQSAIAVVDITSGQSEIVANAAETGMQINAYPHWTANSANVTFTAFNPINRLLGGTPRLFEAQLHGPVSAHASIVGQQASIVPLSSGIPNVVAMG